MAEFVLFVCSLKDSLDFRKNLIVGEMIAAHRSRWASRNAGATSVAEQGIDR
jgi:hypothetical protein